MKISKTSIVGALLLFSAPLAAQGSKVVTFSLTKGELATEQSRRVLLDRIEAHSFRSCDTGSPIVSTKTKRECAIDLRDQFIKGIDDEALTLLVKSEGEKPFLAARR